MMRDVIPAERERIFVIRPAALYQFDIKPFLLKKAALDPHENGRFASKPDVADANFVGSGSGGGAAVFLTACEQEETEESGAGNS